MKESSWSCAAQKATKHSSVAGLAESGESCDDVVLPSFSFLGTAETQRNERLGNSRNPLTPHEKEGQKQDKRIAVEQTNNCVDSYPKH